MDNRIDIITIYIVIYSMIPMFWALTITMFVETFIHRPKILKLMSETK